MKILNRFYIGGQWVEPSAGSTQVDIVDPATEALTGKLAMGTAEDADRAVAAARAAFPERSAPSREERIAAVARVIECYRGRLDDIAESVRSEIGAPITLCKNLQAPIGLAQ